MLERCQLDGSTEQQHTDSYRSNAFPFRKISLAKTCPTCVQAVFVAKEGLRRHKKERLRKKQRKKASSLPKESRSERGWCLHWRALFHGVARATWRKRGEKGEKMNVREVSARWKHRTATHRFLSL